MEGEGEKVEIDSMPGCYRYSGFIAEGSASSV